jgi:tetratricopeptide (TPR) repeat protein
VRPWYWARQEWQQAQDALRRGDLVSAAACLERFLQYRPDDAAAWFLAGRTARRLDRIAEAEHSLERCQQLVGVTDATRLEWDLLRIQQGELSDAHVRLRMTVGPDHPDAPYVLEALARGYMKCGRLHDALQACELCIARQPQHLWPWFWRGWIFERLGNEDRAKQDYEKAVEEVPDDRRARLALGRVLLRQRQSARATEHFEYLFARFPDDEEVLLGLAECRIDQNQATRATPLIERVLTARASSSQGLLLRGKVAFHEGGPDRGEHWLRQAVKSAPDDAEALNWLVKCLYAQDKETEANQLALRLEQLRSDLRRIDELVRIVAQQPDEAAPRHEVGILFLKHSRSEEGLHWLNGALRAKGDHRPTHAALADYYRRKGDEVLAETHRQLAETP